MDETRLEMATRHVRTGRDVVRRQQALVAVERARGRSIERAEGLLALFQRVLAAFEDDLASILEDRRRSPRR